jgi:hypothetical protein
MLIHTIELSQLVMQYINPQKIINRPIARIQPVSLLKIRRPKTGPIPVPIPRAS